MNQIFISEVVHEEIHIIGNKSNRYLPELKESLSIKRDEISHLQVTSRYCSALKIF